MGVKWHVCIKHVINRIQQFSACGQLSNFEFYAIIRFERKLLFFSSSHPNTSRKESTTQYLIDREPNEEDTKTIENANWSVTIFDTKSSLQTKKTARISPFPSQRHR